MYIKIIKSKRDISNLLLKFSDNFIPSLLDRIEDLDSYVEKLQNKAINLVAIDSNDIIYGFVSFYANDNIKNMAYLIILSVDVSSQKCGIGKYLLNKAEAISKEQGMKHIKLRTQNNNKNAIVFYERNGYTICEYLHNNNIYMQKELK